MARKLMMGLVTQTIMYQFNASVHAWATTVLRINYIYKLII